ncbi:ABC transporter permease subunit [Kitasatospora viridis]|uniref:Branched-chain amino acid transport system permease protein n=1 Tax=Kitasatospora viridis TaxID=281105 RepID=A0A561SFB9_9ACTN|nr:ABC transporter permease [Kitasatospora viridis]TWF73564.1 branched-chain amino acid transport system permease protein [Kitasatospora viridis]
MAAPGLAIDFALAGVAVGSAAALSGVGLVVCYRLTGVLNLAQGGIAVLTAYLLRELVVVRGWPLWLGAVLCLALVAPGLGVLLHLLVFGPLRRRGAGVGEVVVAGVGVLVLLIGLVAAVWGTAPLADVPSLVPARSLTLPGGHLLRLDTVAQLAAVLLVTAVVWAVGRFTGFGVRARAVADDPRLAELAGVDANAVGAVGWAFGALTAGLVGVLLAPFVLLDPYGLPLLVLETLAVAVAARFRSLPVAVVVGLALGVGQAELTWLRPPGTLGPVVDAAQSNLFAVALLVAALVPWGAAEQGLLGGGTPLPTLPTALPPTLPTTLPTAVRARVDSWSAGLVVLVLLTPLALRGDGIRAVLTVPGLGLVLLSTVLVTGDGGLVSLAQGAFAGLGALGTAQFASGQLPSGAALVVAALGLAAIGVLAGWPVVHRRGLVLALVTFALAVGLSRFVFEQPYATAGLTVLRPAPLRGDRALYAAELVVLGLGVLLVAAVRRGRLGRALLATRDHEAGAWAAGVPVPGLKLLVFALGAALAGAGGVLLALAGGAFDASVFDPVQGLVWFAAIVVAGVDSVAAAVLTPFVLTGLDAATVPGVSAVAVGALAAVVGRLPGGLAGWARRVRRAGAG